MNRNWQRIYCLIAATEKLRVVPFGFGLEVIAALVYIFMYLLLRGTIKGSDEMLQFIGESPMIGFVTLLCCSFTVFLGLSYVSIWAALFDLFLMSIDYIFWQSLKEGGRNVQSQI